MNYQKEYATLVGQVDTVISVLERCAPYDLVVKKAEALLIAALQEAEERYVSPVEER